MYSFCLQEKPELTLVHFVGDEKLSVDFPHGNSKKNKYYTRVAPSVIRRAEQTRQTPSQAYVEEVENAPTDIASQKLRTPRNKETVRNAKKRIRRKNEPSDAFLSLQQMALESSDIRLLITVPELILVTIDPLMKEEMINIMNIPYKTCEDKQLLGYDTTFEFGDFFYLYNNYKRYKVSYRVGKLSNTPNIYNFS